MCCPIQMRCYPSLLASSNVYCCNSRASTSQCKESIRHPPACLPENQECSSSTGGGCCPKASICSPNGCLQIKDSSILGPSTSHQSTRAASTKTSISMQTDRVTVTQIPAATITTAKEAEVVQKGDGSKQTAVLTFCVPYMSAWFLICVAVLMGMM